MELLTKAYESISGVIKPSSGNNESDMISEGGRGATTNPVAHNRQQGINEKLIGQMEKQETEIQKSVEAGRQNAAKSSTQGHGAQSEEIQLKGNIDERLRNEDMAYKF